ncbi:MAG: hypothetical protein ABII82_13870 [Verrucomicrobiota bacterium]
MTRLHLSAPVFGALAIVLGAFLCGCHSAEIVGATEMTAESLAQLDEDVTALAARLEESGSTVAEVADEIAEADEDAAESLRTVATALGSDAVLVRDMRQTVLDASQTNDQAQSAATAGAAVESIADTATGGLYSALLYGGLPIAGAGLFGGGVAMKRRVQRRRASQWALDEQPVVAQPEQPTPTPPVKPPDNTQPGGLGVS